MASLSAVLLWGSLKHDFAGAVLFVDRVSHAVSTSCRSLLPGKVSVELGGLVWGV